MSPLESHQPVWASVQKLSNDGLMKEKSKRSLRPAVREDMTLIPYLTLQGQTESPSYMPEFQAALKSLTSLNRLTFFSLTTQGVKLSKISDQDSTTEEKDFYPYWTGFSQMMSDWLSLPTKIDSAVSASILSHGSAQDKNVKYWFSTKVTLAQSEKWLKISSPLFTSSVADSTGSENTKSTSLKTATYQVYPSKVLVKIWKTWVSAVRKVFNIAISYLNENQGFPKPTKEKGGFLGGKFGFKKFLKSSGLIPDWCKELKVSKLLDNAIIEAYTAWITTDKNPKFIGKGKNRKPHPKAGLRTAKFRSVRDQKLTLQFDPTGYKNGHWMISQTKHLPVADFKGHDFCVLTDGSTELTYNKGRWFAHFPIEFKTEKDYTATEKIVALDPGVRTFMTGFDGNGFLEFGKGDFTRLSKLCTHLDKLKSKHDLSTGRANKRLRYKLRFAMERLRTKIKNLRIEAHKQVGSYLAQSYDVVILPTFETSKMVVKKSRKLHSKTARNMMTWAFYQFSQTLQHLCNRYGSKLLRLTEEYTSKTCTKCGHIHRKLGSSKKFICPHCGYEIDRDFNGAVGIFLKAMWDTTLINDISEDHVVLGLSKLS